MKTFHIDDLVSIFSDGPQLSSLTGRILDLDEESSFDAHMYRVQVEQTGLISFFPASHLELIEESWL